MGAEIFIIFLVFGVIGIAVKLIFNVSDSNDTPSKTIGENPIKYEAPKEIDPISGSFKCSACGAVTNVKESRDVNIKCEYCGSSLEEVKNIIEERYKRLHHDQLHAIEKRQYDREREIRLQESLRISREEMKLEKRNQNRDARRSAYTTRLVVILFFIVFLILKGWFSK